MHYVDQAHKAQELPLGHYGIKIAQKRITNVYAATREIERKFAKKFKGQQFCNLLGAERIAKELCKTLKVSGAPKCRAMISGDTYYENYDVAAFAGKELVFRISEVFLRIPLVTVIHETAHWICHKECLNQGHDQHHEDFLWVEQMCLDVVLGWY